MSEIRVDTISEKTSANGVAVDGVTLKDGAITSTAASTITVADNSDTLTLKSTDTDASAGPILRLTRDSSSPANDDVLGQIFFTGEDAGGNATNYASIRAIIADKTDGSEDGQLFINRIVAGTDRRMITMTGTATVFNEDSVDIDFRVESNGNTHALFVDGGNEQIGLLPAGATVGADVQIGFHDTATTATSMGTAHANDATLLIGGANSGTTQGSIYLGGQNVSADGVAGAVYGFSGGNQNSGIEFLEGSSDAHGQIKISIAQGTGGTLVEALKIGNNGATTITVTDNSDTLTLKSTDTDADIGPNLRLYRAVAGAASDAIGTIDWAAQDAGGGLTDYASAAVTITDATDGSEDATLTLKVMNAGSLNQMLTISGPETVVNEGSKDHNFRVESDGNANMLFVDGGNNKVGIGTNSPSELLEIANTSGDPGLRLNGAASGNPLIDFAQNGTQKAYFQYLDSGDAFTYQSDGTHTFQAGGSTEYFRISTAFSGPVSGKFSTFGESAPDCGDGGMTLQQGSNDDNIMTFKSTDVAHARTSVAETDTYAEFKKASSTDGGLHLTTINDAGNVSFYVDAHAREIDTGKGTGDHGTMNFDANTHDGSGSGTSLNSNGNMVTFSNDNSVRFIFDAEGDLHADGSLNASAFDTYEDAQLVRAYDLSHGKGVIASQFDKFVQYNKEDLTDAGLVGRVNHETLKDGTEAKPLINMTGFVRLHNGAIWQQYEKHQKLASAFYKLAEKTIGKEEADKLLTEEEIQLLN